ncbi:hypothetical protein DEU56DRAFT_729669 [Suillus clintonianus]|uniref:uncharacterized protein n=1 Tax=Suillus clintonianus TaxID=1904413 RepID=UPI001B866F65|nr:uncharacterized protein DEU56DRAFT_729669 [Suillus clintonianus]KAG2149247.1 hypothetical protein DEU56DRAFT_729669 [Suillus clintonianus]
MDFSSDFNEILRGDQQLEISHSGRELEDLAQEIMGDFWKGTTPKGHGPRRNDHRTRRDRVQHRVDAFDAQLPAITEAYLEWSLQRVRSGTRPGFFHQMAKDALTEVGADSGSWTATIVDLFCAEKVTLTLKATDSFIASALVRQGVIPCSPISPSVAVTVDALEFYRIAHLRDLHFSMQAFAKTLCDLHAVEYRRYLSRQLTIAFDLYLQVRSSVDALVAEVLNRNTPDWRLKHACPSCTYTLADEDQLTFKLLYAMDGNDSLKRILQRTLGVDDEDTQSSELPTTQQVRGDRYLPRDYVNSWGNGRQEEANTTIGTDDTNPCAGRWKNMDDEKTKRMWGVYDETGIFIAVCHHGFSLVMADMVQSRELAKYPLAVVSKLLDTFGSDLGGGYDIGCQFKTTLDNSSLGTRAQSLNYTSLVGAFHGHAHKRLCQLDHLATYVSGLGLEDLETCERTFSKSNALASTMRYASIFHRQQGITNYFEHNDDYEVYANLSNFLYHNYKQALDIICDSQITLPKLMQDINVTEESTFDEWLKEEKVYLQGLCTEPELETLQMEYWQKLVNLSASKNELDTASSLWAMSTPSNAHSLASDESATRRLETTRRHALENFEKDLGVVQELEQKLGILHRWTPEDADWQNAGRLIANRKYQRSLDQLEGLIVARIFELTKMNRSGTGYKMRKHIAKALQTRSMAIRNALDRYNAAVRALSPPRRMLKWEEVVEYAFLADFDLLRDSRSDVSQRQWATPAARQATDLYFKHCRAKEEITRLNVEVRCLASYIHDEDHYLRECQQQAEAFSPALAHQISLRRQARGRFNFCHIKHLQDIARLPGFSGTIVPGVCVLRGTGESTSLPHASIPARLTSLTPNTLISSSSLKPLATESADDLDDNEEELMNMEEAAEALQNVLHIAMDS